MIGCKCIEIDLKQLSSTYHGNKYGVFTLVYCLIFYYTPWAQFIFDTCIFHKTPPPQILIAMHQWKQPAAGDQA